MIRSVFLFLLAATALEMRGPFVKLGGLHFYVTTARIAIVLACVVTLWLFINKIIFSLWHQYKKIFLTCLAFIGTLMVSVLINKKFGTGLEQTAYIASMFYIFWIALGSPRLTLIRFPKYLIALGVMEAILALPEFGFTSFKNFLDITFRPMFLDIGPAAFWNNVRCSTGSFQNPHILGAFMTLCILFTWKTIERKALRLILITLFLSALLCSQSLLALSFILIFFIWQAAQTALASRNIKNALPLAGIAVAIFLIVSATERGKNLTKHFFKKGQAAAAETPSLDSRQHYWSAGLAIWSKKKIFGIAPGSFPEYYYPMYRPHAWGFAHPHNLFIRSLAESGLVGAGVFLLLLIWIAKEAFRCGFRHYHWPLLAFAYFETVEDFTRDAFPAVLLALTVAYSIHSARAKLISIEPAKKLLQTQG